MALNRIFVDWVGRLTSGILPQASSMTSIEGGLKDRDTWASNTVAVHLKSKNNMIKGKEWETTGYTDKIPSDLV